MGLQTFIICSSTDSQDLQKKIIKEFNKGDNYYIVRNDSQWIVAADMTTQQVYEKIEIDGDRKPNVVVFLTANYWGLHNKDMWEWLELD